MPDRKGVVAEVLFTSEAWTLRPSKQRPGWYNAVAPDGQVRSVQPNGKLEWRPNESDGPYEQCKPVGNQLIYSYDWDGKHLVHALAWTEDVN